VDQDARPSRFRDNFLRKREASFRIAPGYSIALRWSNSFDLVSEVSLFLQEQTILIGEEKLQIAELWPINGWIIDLCQNAASDREPDSPPN
jgi:hypothetical protein